MELLQNILSNIWAVLLVVLFFGGSIFVHELGHFLAARWRGMHVERFSIGFGPKIFSWRGKDGVEYRLSWLPLGGYVSLPQLADMAAIEGESKTDVSKLPPPSYSTKVIVFAAGAVFNVIFAFILACIVWGIGEPSSSILTSTTVAEVREKIPNEDGVEVTSPAMLAGLQPGDTILKVDGTEVRWFNDIVERLALSSGWSKDGQRETIFTVKRGEQTMDLTVHPIRSGPEKLRMVGFTPVSTLLVDRTVEKSDAANSGLKSGDQVIAINGKDILTPYQLAVTLADTDSAKLEVAVKRDGQMVTLAYTRTEPANAKAGYDSGIFLQPGIIYTHPKPWDQIWNNVVKTYRTVVALVNPRSDVNLSHLSSPIGITTSFFRLAQAGMPFVLWFTILINVNLAILNMLPIPVLDGGHILFATIAKLRGKNLPVNFIAVTQNVFMLLLFSLIFYAGFNDIRREIRENRNESPKAPVEETAPAEPKHAE